MDDGITIFGEMYKITNTHKPLKAINVIYVRNAKRFVILNEPRYNNTITNLIAAHFLTDWLI